MVAVWLRIPDAPISKSDLLMALNYLKLYEITEVAHQRWNISENTWRERVWNVILYLSENFSTINWNDRTILRPLFSTSYAAVDVTFAPVEIDKKHWGWQYLFYSAKHKMHGLKYEVVVSIADGSILWIGGPATGKTHDLTILREGGLLEELAFFEVLLGDKGYVGEPDSIWVPAKGKYNNLQQHEREWNIWLGHYRVVVENTFARLKKFAFLKQKWRNDLDLHEHAFNVVANVINLELMIQPVRQNPELQLRI